MKQLLEKVPEESVVRTILSSFKCSMDPDIQDFLKERAIPFEKAHKSRTYLVVLREKSNLVEMGILGYFSVAIDHLLIDEGTSKTLKRKLNGIFNEDRVPCYLIGQLARNDSCPKDDLSGREILRYVLNVLANAHELVGGRFARVDCKDREELLEFYRNNGFRMVSGCCRGRGKTVCVNLPASSRTSRMVFPSFCPRGPLGPRASTPRPYR